MTTHDALAVRVDAGVDALPVSDDPVRGICHVISLYTSSRYTRHLLGYTRHL